MNETANISLNTSVLERASDAAVAAKDIAPLVLHRMLELVAAPFVHQEMLWIIFHLALTLFVLEFYFDRHGDEELGWAAAVANSLVLFIIAIDLIRHSFHEATPWAVLKKMVLAAFTDAALGLPPQVLILILFVGTMGAVVTVINYYHLLPRRLAFEVSGHPPINFIAYLAIVIVYTAGTPEEIPLDIPTLVAAGLLYIVLLVVVFMIRKYVRRVVHGSNRRRSIWG